MSSRYGILSILLFFVVLILGYENLTVWSSSSPMGPKKISGKKGEAKPDLPLPAAAPKETAPPAAFNVVAAKNIFSPERKEFSSTAAAAMAKPVTRPQVALYGVVIAENYQTASIVNPGRPLYKGERETKTLKVGDMIGEYKLTKILEDRIVMEAGEVSFEVFLYDPRAPKRRVEVKTPTQPATVTSIGPGATPPAGAPPTPAGVPPPSPPPSAAGPPSPTVRPAVPLPVPRPPGSVPERTFQPSGAQPTSPSPPAVPDPGLWRGRRPVTPGGTSQ